MMIEHIDWLSFSMVAGDWTNVPSHRLFEAVVDQFIRFNPLAASHLFYDRDYIPRTSRAPYSIAWTDSTGGVVVFAHPMLTHFLVEMSGRECEYLGSLPGASDFLAAMQTRLTRIDIACDMLTETRPDAFTLQREPGRFKAWGEVVSQSGHTIYVGSRESDRYVRVYRYNEPHPRAHLLRCEFVLKAEQAKSTALSVLANGISQTVAELGNSFGWKHADWKPNAETEDEAKAWLPERKQGKTVRWLYAQVIPALLRLDAEGIIDVLSLLDEIKKEIIDKDKGIRHNLDDIKYQ